MEKHFSTFGKRLAEFEFPPLLFKLILLLFLRNMVCPITHINYDDILNKLLLVDQGVVEVSILPCKNASEY